MKWDQTQREQPQLCDSFVSSGGGREMPLTGGSQGAGPAVLWEAWSPSDTPQGSSSAPWAGCWCWYWPTRPSTRSLAPRWACPLSPGWERGLVVPAGTAQQHEGLPSLRAPPLRRSQPRSGCWEAELCVLPPPAFPGASAILLHPLHPAEHGEVSSSTGRFSVSSTARFFPSADPGAGQE